MTTTARVPDFIPAEQTPDFIPASLTPEMQLNKVRNATPTDFEIERNPENHRGLLGGIADEVTNFTTAIPGMVKSAARGITPEGKLEHAASLIGADQQRKASGRSTPYRIAADIAPLAGVNVPAIEQASDVGDTGKIIGIAGTDAAPAIASEVARAPIGKTVGNLGRAVERNAPTIGKVAGYGAGTIGALESLREGHPIGALLSAGLSPRAARIAEIGARGTGRFLGRFGHPDAPYAPVTGPERVEGEYLPPDVESTPWRQQLRIAVPEPYSQLQLPEKSVIPVDTIAADAGEVARRHMIGLRPTEPVVLPTQNRGLMLPERGATIAPEPLPPRLAVDTIAKEAVRGAGGKPEIPVPPERGKPIYQRPRPITEKPPSTEPQMTKAESSALNGYHYDPATQTMTVETKAGAKYRYGEVTADEFSSFEKAESKGKAYQDIKNNHVQTGVNYGSGWTRKVPAKNLHSSETVPDLVPSLEESIRRARAKAKQ